MAYADRVRDPRFRALIQKANPYHDASGRFTSADQSVSAPGGVKTRTEVVGGMKVEVGPGVSVVHHFSEGAYTAKDHKKAVLYHRAEEKKLNSAGKHEAAAAHGKAATRHADAAANPTNRSIGNAANMWSKEARRLSGRH
jgi:hypothetical protein